MGPTWGRQDPGGRQVGHMNLAIWAIFWGGGWGVVVVVVVVGEGGGGGGGGGVVGGGWWWWWWGGPLAGTTESSWRFFCDFGNISCHN